jgi:release factor glutamine methyltransferase
MRMSEWTTQKLLTWITEYLTKNGVDAPRLSAELLLSHVLKLTRIELYTQFNKIVDRTDLDVLHGLVKRAGAHEPVAYLVGRTEFYSIELEVDPHCLIPRPETELLVQKAIEFLRTREGTQHVCDLCTGSGCIAVAIAKNFAEAKVTATDISDAALAVAARNVEKYALGERVRLLCGDLFEPLVPHLDVTQWDLIVCNPPYVSAAEYEALEKNVKDYEPELALRAGDDGLDIYRRISAQIDQYLRPDGTLLLEIGYAQGPAVRALLEQAGLFSDIKIEKDHQNNDRVVTARRVAEV